MWNKKRLFLMMAFFTFLYGFLVKASASGFITESLPDGGKEYQSKVFPVFFDEPMFAPIESFDVQSNGSFAVVYDASGKSKRTIGIYDSSGIFQYGYTLGSGGVIGIEWCDEQSLYLYFQRGDIVMSIDNNGACTYAAQIVTKNEDNQRYWSQKVFATSKRCGNDIYQLQNDFGILNCMVKSYSKLVKTTADGESIVLYDVSDKMFAKTVVLIAAGILFLCILSILVVKMMKRVFVEIMKK